MTKKELYKILDKYVNNTEITINGKKFTGERVEAEKLVNGKWEKSINFII